jgi:flagellar hook-length control protein FliK
MSDVTASTSYQAAPPKPARFDPSQGFDSFGSLVDSSIRPEPAPSATAQGAPQRPSNRTTTDRPAPRDTASDRSAPSNRADPGERAGRSDAPTTAASNPSDTKADKASPSDGKAGDAKSGDGNSGETKSSDKSAKDSAGTDASATDATTVAQPDVPALTVQNLIANLLPVTVAPADAATIAPTSDGSAKPLAIAAAALAVAAATTRGSAPIAEPETSAATVVPDNATDVTPITSEESSVRATTISAAAAKPATAALASVAVAVAVAEQPGVTDTTDVALAAGISGPQTIGGGKTASTRGTPQAQAKGQAASDGSTSPDLRNTAAATTEIGLSGAIPQPATAAKPDEALEVAVAAKSDLSNATPTTTDALLSRDHSSAGNNPPTPPANTDASLAVPATFQSQVSSSSSTLSAATLTATAATGAPVPLSGLAVEIAASARSGKTRFDVRLDPADLGRIDVRIDVDRNGQVISHLRVEKPETLSMLQQDAPQLRQALDDAGLKTGHGGLQFSLRDQSSSGQNNGNQTGGNAQRLVVSEDDTVPVAVAGRSYGRTLNSNGGVDIRV